MIRALLSGPAQRAMPALLWLLACLASCGPQTPKEIDYDKAYDPYIHLFTQGKVGRSASISIRLNEAVVSPEQLYEETEGFIRFDPPLAGSGRWTDVQTFEFEADELLPNGQNFVGHFNLKALFPDIPSDLEEFPFSFHTDPQDFQLHVDEMKASERKNMKWQFLEGNLEFANMEDPLVAKKVLTASQNGRQLPIHWKSDQGFYQHFVVDSILRQDKEGEVILHFDGAPLAVSRKGDHKVRVPALGEFKIMSAKVRQDDEQRVVISFSDPLSGLQDWEGLIQMAGVKFKAEPEGNTLVLFPQQHLIGSYKLNVHQGLQNILGYRLQKGREFTLLFEDLHPAVQAKGEGVIIPRSNGKLPFSFRAANLSGVTIEVMRIHRQNALQFLQVNELDGSSELHRVGEMVYQGEVDLAEPEGGTLRAWNTHTIDLQRIIQPKQGAIYHVSISFDKKHSLCDCSHLADLDLGEEEYGDSWEFRDDPCAAAYYWSYNKPSLSQNVLASDIGLIAKRGEDGQFHFVTTQLSSGGPMTGVQLELYNFEQRLLGRTSSDGQGFARIHPAESPYFLVARKGQQVGYLKLSDGYSLPLSRFDIGGVDFQDGVKGFIYGERGVWRPGDTIHMHFVVDDPYQEIPDDHPVELRFYDPEHKEVEHRVVNRGLNGMYYLPVATDPKGRTGHYTAQVKLGEHDFRASFMVETIRPHRLKIQMEKTGKGQLAIAPGDTLRVRSQWLHGSPAAQLRAKCVLWYQSGHTAFPDFQGFEFDDASASRTSGSAILVDASLDQGGQLNFPADFRIDGLAQGMLKGKITTLVFEKSGNYSTHEQIIQISPYDRYVGILTDVEQDGIQSIQPGEAHEVKLALVDREGQALDTGTVEVSLFQLRDNWWRDRHRGDRESFMEAMSDYFLKADTVAVKDGRATWRFQASPHLWGRFLLRACDGAGHCSSVILYAERAWDDDSYAYDRGGAAMLDVQLSKGQAQVGEFVELSFPSSGHGKALVSIENARGVLHKQWISLQAGQTRHRIPVTSAMVPNVFVHVSMLQTHQNRGNDRPIRMYGLQPLEVEDPGTRLRPMVRAPNEFSPMEKAKFTVSEEQGKPMTYSLAIVDEGLLSLTGFQTPDPHGMMYQRQSLGVITWDLFDYVADPVGKATGKMLATGGDGYGDRGDATKQNRFRPVVKVIGPFYLPAGGRKNHSIEMPNYIGEVRVMVVAAHKGRFGSGEAKVPVRKGLMVHTSLPRVLGPGETVDLPATLFLQDSSLKEVEVRLETSGLVEPEGPAQSSFKVTRQGEQDIHFRLKVKEGIGKAEIKITAKGGGQTAVFHVEAEVRPSSPSVKHSESHTLPAEGSWQGRYQPKGLPGSREARVELSPLPPINLRSRLNGLVRYPHGCVEQTTSKLLPQLYLTRLTDMDEDTRRRVESFVRVGIHRLRGFQNADGSLSYWPDGSEASEYGTNYAGGFLVRAKNAGYPVPQAMLDALIAFQTEKSNDWKPSGLSPAFTVVHDQEALIQADRLFQLALAGKPALGAMNRLKAAKDLPVIAKWRLATAYYLAGRPDAAREISQGLDIHVAAYSTAQYSFGSELRDEAMILECLVLMDRRDEAQPILKRIARELGSDKVLNTQEAGYCLLALGEYLSQGEEDAFQLRYRLGGGDWVNVECKGLVSEIDLPAEKALGIEVESLSKVPLYARLSTQHTPLRQSSERCENQIHTEFFFTDLEGNLIHPGRILQGEDMLAYVVVENMGQEELPNLALTQLFPSGWQIRNPKIESVQLDGYSDRADYVDIRDDRVHHYFNLPGSSSHLRAKKKFRVLLNASFAGRYFLPGVNCESMYDDQIHSIQPGDWVEVVPRSVK